ncbi:MAG TPA: hypothetical protein VG098_01975 [Nitrososphaera sp.]|nr:hypothetical protein [Nitrososphaera sp.]
MSSAHLEHPLMIINASNQETIGLSLFHMRSDLPRLRGLAHNLKDDSKNADRL